MQKIKDFAKTRTGKLFIEAIILIICIALLVVGNIIASSGRSALDNEDRSGSIFAEARVVSVGEKQYQNDIPGEYEDYNLPMVCRILSGQNKGISVEAVQNVSNYNNQNIRPVSVGDKIILTLVSTSDSNGQLLQGGTWYFAEYIRSDALWVLLIMFAAGLLLFGKANGARTIVSLTLTVCAVFFMLIPAVFTGKNIYGWAIFTCLYIVVMTLCIVNGLKHLSLATGLGCVAGVAFSCIAIVVTDFSVKLTGFVDETSIYLSYIDMNGAVDLKGLVFASVIIGSVGAVMDVAVDIAASLHEIALKVGKPTFGSLISSGFTIGRDIMGTMSNTLILAHVGSSIGFILLVYYNSSNSLMYLFNREIIIVECIKILIGSLGILMTIPFTTLICAYLYTRKEFEKAMLEQTDSDTVSDADSDELLNIAKGIRGNSSN